MTEPLTVITLYSTPTDSADAMVETWPTHTASFASAPGFVGARLHRAVLPDTPYQLIDLVQWNTPEQAHAALTRHAPVEAAVYQVVSVTPDTVQVGAGVTEPLTLINLFSIPARAAEGFVAGWPASTARLTGTPGFRGTRLHRAVSPESPYQIINVARWDSLEQWQTALADFRPPTDRRPADTGSVTVQPAFYRVVHTIPAR